MKLHFKKKLSQIEHYEIMKKMFKVFRACLVPSCARKECDVTGVVTAGGSNSDPLRFSFPVSVNQQTQQCHVFY